MIGIAAHYGDFIIFRPCNAAEQQNGRLHHFEMRNASKRFIVKISYGKIRIVRFVRGNRANADDIFAFRRRGKFNGDICRTGTAGNQRFAVRSGYLYFICSRTAYRIPNDRISVYANKRGIDSGSLF